jgi:N-acetylmuramoyl-L-alanine amidase CwlA
MSYSINNRIILGLPKNPFRKGVGAYEGVVAHSTATPEATDEREVEYFRRNWNTIKAFVHFFVDWDSISQTADTNYQAWGAGNGNNRYLHVELCETKDPAKFKESYKRYVWLLAYLLKQKNLGVTDGQTLVSHEWVSRNLGGTNHTDPIGYLKSHGVTWAKLVEDVKAAYSGSVNPPYRVIIPNTAFWQARSLVIEFEQRGFKAYGSAYKSYVSGQKPAETDPYKFIIETDLETAKELVIELKTRGYDRTFGEKM